MIELLLDPTLWAGLLFIGAAALDAWLIARIRKPPCD